MISIDTFSSVVDNRAHNSYSKNRKPSKGRTFLNHFIAILIRKVNLLKRSIKSILFAVIGSILFCSLAIVIQYLMKYLIKDTVTPVTFNSFKNRSIDIFLVLPQNPMLPINKSIEKSLSIMTEMFINETTHTPRITNFSSRDEINKYMYDSAIHFREPLYVAMGIDYTESFQNFLTPFKFLIYYNGSWGDIEMVEEVQLSRVLWKYAMGSDKDFMYYSTRLLKRVGDLVFGLIGPILICCGLIAMVPLFIFQPIYDIKGDVRSFMVSCSLTLTPYWLATFLVDLLTWFITSSLVWVMFMIAQTGPIVQNKWAIYYSFVMSGPAFIMFVYCASFAFDSAEAAPRQIFIILNVLMILPVIATVIVQPDQPPIWCECLFAILPHLSLERLLTIICSNIYILQKPFSYYWKTKRSLIFLVGGYVNVVFYGLLLMAIETIRKKLAPASTKKNFGNYIKFFEEQRRKHQITEEANTMAQRVIDNNEDWAVKIEHASRLFFNSMNEPIPAVNDVSLGVKKGSIFGFLGANGAGKTTLIKMITSMLPPSEGSIYINNINILDVDEPNIIGVCPQFNSHLCMDMTPLEHFNMYRYIYQLETDDARDRENRLIAGLGLDNYKDKPAGELSGGEQRKLAISLTFYGPADIILLDEPTSSLDPVARHNVHEMISSYRGEKTFMLCTHLLSEAESLCDMISIMIKGNLYTCGSPQYLSTKFGTEYKIDIGLDDKSPETGQKVDEFFTKTLPLASLTIKRPKARIYSMPAASIDIYSIFRIMEDGSCNNNGFKYYTCSSSSLERVFMEIVHMSENDEYEKVVGTKSL